ncbi:MAG TPA: hypothetical protein VGY31_10375, partial [Terriglobia bacterium]|nr:hypothetical protein [Terriglobia bacterium]
TLRAPVGLMLRVTKLMLDQAASSQLRLFGPALRTMGDCHKEVDYIHLNRVREDLVHWPEEWPWSSIHNW